MRSPYAALLALWLVLASPIAADGARDRVMDEALARRLDRAAAAERRAQAIASERVAQNTEGDVVLGDKDPELLMRWELMNFIAGVFSDDARETYISKWRDRIGRAEVPHSLLVELPLVIAPFLRTEAEMKQAQIQLKHGAGENEAAIRGRWSSLNGSLCGLRAEALAASRATFGQETFDRFLYRVVAPDVLVINSPLDSPADAKGVASMWLWVEDGCR